MNKRIETALRKIAAGRIERGIDSWRNTLSQIPGIGKFYQVGAPKVPNDGYPTFNERLDYYNSQPEVHKDSALRQLHDNVYSSVGGREGAALDAAVKRVSNPKTLDDYVTSGIVRTMGAVDAYKNGGVMDGLAALRYPKFEIKHFERLNELLRERNKNSKMKLNR
jgi:hypothetical protein